MDVVTRQSRLGSLKLPVLRMGEVAVFGAENICRAVAESAPSADRLVEHLAFRATISLASHERLTAFVRAFGKRTSAQQTHYLFDVPPGTPQSP